MSTETKSKVTNGSKKNDTSRSQLSCVVRMQRTTRAKLDGILDKINKKHLGKSKIRHDAVICHALDLLDDEHLCAIRDKSLSNADALTLRYKAMSKGKSNFSWDDFLGLVMEGKVTFGPESLN